MEYYCKLGDKKIKHTSKYENFNSENHPSSGCSIISRYILLNLDFDKVDEIMRKFVNFYNKKY